MVIEGVFLKKIHLPLSLKFMLVYTEVAAMIGAYRGNG
jgi:hypothetical protein